MPMIGFFLGTLFADAIEAFDHWVAFGLLALIGINMLREAFSKECDCGCCGEDADLSVKTMFVLAVATSIDALCIGFVYLNLPVEEAMLDLDKFIDGILRTGLNEITIIHGKGTGALRKGIHVYLRKHPNIRTFRVGTFGEGEEGVTIAELK